MRIDESLREALLLEAAALGDALGDARGDSPARAEYDALSRAAAGGEVHDELATPLERLLELVLRTGRMRRLHGPEAEAAAVRLYHATPRGRALDAELAEVNAALAALAGQVVARLAISARGPGAYALTIEAASATLTLDIAADGVGVKDVSVGA
ncbi:MAG TPA: hypothetical protein VFW66_07345 [Gemmatimonadales bacterium]|nr:hypothetical protein [Gemmatimonadales bacterium]